MFCDHYLLVAPSLTSSQLNTCTAYYQNASHQPWYMGLVTVVPILIGIIIMVRNIKRTIYDTISVPLFLTTVGIFVLKIGKNVESITADTQASNSTKEGYLKQIAHNHGIMIVLLVLIFILQLLAERQVKIPAKKKL